MRSLMQQLQLQLLKMGRLKMSPLGLILLILVIVLLVGAVPTWPHSANWGYFPAGGLSTVLVIVLVLVLLGRI